MFKEKVPNFVWAITAGGFLVFMIAVSIQASRSDDIDFTIANAQLKTSRKQLKIATEASLIREQNEKVTELASRVLDNQEALEKYEKDYTALAQDHNDLIISCSAKKPQINIDNNPVIDKEITNELEDIKEELKESDRELTEEIDKLINEKIQTEPSIGDGAIRNEKI